MLLIVSVLMCSSCFSAPVKKSDFSNLKIEFEETENPLYLKATVSGRILDSALCIESYKIKYANEKVYIDINRKLGASTGVSMDYHIQFLVNRDVKKIYIGKDLFWSAALERGELFLLNELKSADTIVVSKTVGNEQITLNAEQIRDFLKKLKVAKNLGMRKCLYPYRVSIYSGSDEIRFMTDGKNLAKSGTAYEHFALESDLSELFESLFEGYRRFENPLTKKTCLFVFVWAGEHYALCKLDGKRYFVLRIILGSGVPVAGITGFYGKEKNGSIEFNGGNKFVLSDGIYTLHRGGQTFVCSEIGEDQILRELKIER